MFEQIELNAKNVKLFFNARNEPFITFWINGKHFAVSLDKNKEMCEHGQLWSGAWTNKTLSETIEDFRPCKVELLD